MSAALDAYEALLLDLDGTVYHGPHAVPGAADAVAEAHRRGVRIRFVTNNASRGPAEVAAQLNEIGVPAEPAEVSTSAQAAAGVLREKMREAGQPGDARVLVLGTDALAEEITAVGLRPVRRLDVEVAAVVQGLSQRTGWAELADACLAIRAGAVWVACNADPTLPTERGLLPGNGALVAALTAATGEQPIFAGKPQRPLLDQAVSSCGARTALVVGDRLDTDISGANNAGLDAMLVLSGVSTAWDLLVAPEWLRPRYLAEDIRAIGAALDDLAIGPQRAWSVRVEGASLRVSRTDSSGEPVQLLRAMCEAWWRAGGGSPDVEAQDEQSKAALRELGVLDTGLR